jgi:4-amino-4-deoxy-L-arabinose transferase-like glycosyltransferase
VTTSLERTPDTTETTTSPDAHAHAKRWDRIALAVLLIATAVMYLWNITINGMGNQFYAGAAQAGSKDWKALLFGSLDSHNFITVDKPPLSQWVMGLSGQIFGFSSASMLIPEALMAVATVALLYGAVSRISGPRAGLLAGAALALAPVAALMFRYNNPDAAMVLLMMVSAYCTVRALQHAGATSTSGAKWMAAAGAALGFAFLAKMLEGLMVMPAVALVYLIAAPTPLRTRLLHLLGSLAAFVVSAGWFVVLTVLWPASSRAYIAGSTDNNFMNLVLGYNGFSRVLGHNNFFQNFGMTGSAAGTRVLTGRQGFGGAQSPGISRLVSGELAVEIGWLVPAALIAVVLVIVARGRAPRTDPVRAGAILFGGWIVVDGLVLSFMHGFIHSYYCLSLAPAVAGMFAIGVHQMWQKRSSWFGRFGLAAIILTTGIWSWWILGWNSGWLPALRWTILGVVVLAAISLLLVRLTRFSPAMPAFVALGLIGAVAGPAAYAIATIGQDHQGGGPAVGPASSAQALGMGRGGFGQPADNPELDTMLRDTNTDWSAAINGSSSAAGLELSTDTAVMAVGGFSGRDPTPTLGEFIDDVHNHRVAYYIFANTPGHFHARGHTDIANWVATNFIASKVGSYTVYDLSAPR